MKNDNNDKSSNLIYQDKTLFFHILIKTYLAQLKYLKAMALHKQIFP